MKSTSENKYPIVVWFWIAAMLITILQNGKHQAAWITHHTGMQYAIFETERKIFEDFYGKKLNDVLEVYQKHQEMESRAEVVGWYDLPDDWFEQALDKLEIEKKIYFKTRSKNDARLIKFIEAGKKIEQFQYVSFYDAPTAYFYCLRFLIKRDLIHLKPLDVFVYKIT